MNKTIELNEQQVEYLTRLLDVKLNEPEYMVSNTDRTIARNLLEKLTNE